MRRKMEEQKQELEGKRTQRKFSNGLLKRKINKLGEGHMDMEGEYTVRGRQYSSCQNSLSFTDPDGAGGAVTREANYSHVVAKVLA